MNYETLALPPMLHLSPSRYYLCNMHPVRLHLRPVLQRISFSIPHPKNSWRLVRSSSSVGVIGLDSRVLVSRKKDLKKAVVIRRRPQISVSSVTRASETSDSVEEWDLVELAESRGASVRLEALTKWFTYSQGWADISPHLKQHAAHSVPYELLLPGMAELSTRENRILSNFYSWLKKSSDPSYKALDALLKDHIGRSPEIEGRYVPTDTRFIRFDAPLALLAAVLQFNRERGSPGERLSRLYIAQAPLSDLPGDLQLDVPTPELITHLPATTENTTPTEGDLYDSSVWLGLEPTYTPWHRDPNPNLFFQLCGVKAVRMLPPAEGHELFEKVHRRLDPIGGSSRIRGEEMMQGAERQAFLDAVWGKFAPKNLLEVELRPEDVLLLPKGWWHSVKSTGAAGALNASVNWWFRWRAAPQPRPTGPTDPRRAVSRVRRPEKPPGSPAPILGGQRVAPSEDIKDFPVPCIEDIARSKALRRKVKNLWAAPNDPGRPNWWNKMMASRRKQQHLKGQSPVWVRMGKRWVRGYVRDDQVP